MIVKTYKMNIYKLTFTILALVSGLFVQAQRYGNSNTATVVAQNYDISDNLDLQAVASIFGESNDLEDFERRLNDPSLQISNLDLNRDNYVDYLRVIEVADNDVRVIVIQAVLGEDLFQDVATIELERPRNNTSTVHVQIVGNPYIYGPNYIYEPYYWRTPIFFDYFWGVSYRPYYSPWYWGYYPTYYSYWQPMPIYRYRRHIVPRINTRNRYAYTDHRRISRADRVYSGVSRRGIESANPSRSFTQRNQNISNRNQLVQTRSSITNSDTRRAQIGDTRVQDRTSIRTQSGRINSSEIRNSRVQNNEKTVNGSTRDLRATTPIRSNNSTINSSRVEMPRNNRIERSERVNTSMNSSRYNTPNTSSRSNNVMQPSRSQRSDMNMSRSSNFSRSSNATMSRGNSGMSAPRSSGVSNSRSGGSQRGR